MLILILFPVILFLNLFMQFIKFFEHNPYFIFPFSNLSIIRLSIIEIKLAYILLDEAIVNNLGFF